MYTYQDLLLVGENDQDRTDFVMSAIMQHQNTKDYKTAVIADEYDRQLNTTMVNYQKTITDITGRIVPDYYSPNYKMCSNFYNRLTSQRNQYSLSNGVSWTGTMVEVPEGTEGATRKIVWDKYPTATDRSIKYHYEYQLSVPTGIEEKLGKDFDTQLQTLCKAGIDGGVSFGFINANNRKENEDETYHLEVFKITEFVPLYDEENGSLRAGVRWVKISPEKPLRATLFEEDGYTEYIWFKRKENGVEREFGQVYHDKRAYKQIITKSDIDDEEKIYNGENYPTFPIIPFFANKHKQSAIVGMREHIDAYDMIKNEYANTMDDALLYWVLTGAGGFDKAEANKFIYELKQSRVAAIEGDQAIQPVTVNPETAGRETLLDRIERDIYKDYNALDIDQIRAGAVTATQIKAAYENLDMAANEYEYQIIQFLDRLMKVIGIEDTPTFTRSMLINVQELIQILLQAEPSLTSEYVTRKILELLGDGDKADYIINQKVAEELQKVGIAIQQKENEQAENEEETEETEEEENEGEEIA